VTLRRRKAPREGTTPSALDSRLLRDADFGEGFRMPAVLASLIGQIAQSLWLSAKIFPFSGAADRDFVRLRLPAAGLAECLGSSADS
jgi:hypothetical protein